MYQSGAYVEALNKLREGFNIASVMRNLHPNYNLYLRYNFREIKIFRKKTEFEDRMRKEAKLHGEAQQFTTDADQQKGMPEEDIKNKKLISLLGDVFNLIMKIENKLQEKQKKISNLYKNQKKLEKSLKSRFTRSEAPSPQNASRLSERERAKSMKREPTPRMYKSIMCPLRDRCPGDIRPRWPTSETKSISNLGNNCPYAHHYSELHFA